MTLVLLLSGIGMVSGAEKVFDFNLLEVGTLPPGWRPAVTGAGGPPRWEIVKDAAPSAFQSFSSNAEANLKPVVAQTGQDPTDERFPLLIYEDEEFKDFTLTTRIKMVGGEVEQMAGIAFRIQDENNYHVIRASAKGNTLMFYSFINGVRQPPVGNNVEIPADEWITLEVEAKGHEFKFRLNGAEVIPPLGNPNFRMGKIGYWTKSDSISHFVDTKIVYTPVQPQAQTLVQNAKKEFERLIGVRILVPGETKESARILASTEPAEINQAGYKEERLVIDTGEIMYLRGKKEVTVSLPLTDRNGEPIAAVRVTMERFPGQTQKTAIVRAQPIVGYIQNQVFDYDDLLE